MAQVKLVEYSGKGEHGVRVNIDGAEIMDALFCSPGFSSQSVCQQAEREVIDRLGTITGENDTIIVDGDLSRPYILRNWLEANGAQFV